MNWRSRVALVFHFIVARGAQFLAPIVAANLLSAADYGTVEFAHAVASIAVTLLSCGMASLIPFAIIQQDPRFTLRALLLHLAMLTGVAMSAALTLTAVAGHVTDTALLALMLGVLAMQITWTGLLRSSGSATRSLYLEATPFALVLAAAAASRLAWPDLSLEWVFGSLLTGQLLMLVALSMYWRSAAVPSGTLHYRAAMRAGLPLMAAGLLAVVAAASGRVAAGLFAAREDAGAFAAIARVAVLPVVAHQLAVVARFRDLYAVPLGQLERLNTQVLTLVGLAVGVMLLLLPWIAPLFGPVFAGAMRLHPLAATQLCAHVLLWSAVAQNDLLAARHHIMPRVLPWSGAALIISLAGSWALLSVSPASVTLVAACHIAIVAGLFAGQCVAMHRCGATYFRLWSIAVGGYLLLALTGHLYMSILRPAQS